MTRTIPSPPPIQRRNLKEASLSFSQESLWFLQQLDPGNIAYNSNFLIRFTGGIVPLYLERALNELVRRHVPLRTVYPNQGGRPVQVIQPFESFSLPFVDYSGLPEDEQLQTIRRYVSEQGNQPYNLQRGPLVRFALLHRDPNEDYLFFGTHHISFDGWSRQIFFSELMQLYDAFRSGKEPALPELPIHYIDYALWQREWLSGETLEAYLEHWKNILSGDLPVLELPTDRPRPVLQSYRGARYQFNLPRALSAQINDFCQRERMTPFQLLLAAYAVLLMRYTGQEDIILGCPFANRSRPELDGLVGLFVNTLPIRLNLQGNPVVREFLNQVRTVMWDAFTWQAAPFEALVSELSPERDLSRTPVFQVVINLRNVPKRLTSIQGLEMENILRENAPSPFDISLEFDEYKDGTLDASLQYNVDLYDENSIIHMAAHYQNLLGELLMKTDRPLAELEMLMPSERNRIVIDWNDTREDFPQVCIHDLFVEQFEKNSDALAVVCNGNSLTYSDLEKKANQLAHYLKANGVEAEARVGIYLPRSEKIVVSLLAILKAGGAYVPLDLTYPAERIAYMVKDSDPAAIITLSHLSNQLPDQIRKICLDTESDPIDTCDAGRPVSITNNDSLAYVIYTSGSTGRPKGAMNVHKGIANYLIYMKQKYQFNAADRVIQLTSLSFDVSAFEILGTLSYGGTMFIMGDAQMRDPDFIYTAIIDHQATWISCVPTMLRALCESALARERKKNSLRLILPAGEALREADVKLARRAFGESVKLVNLYGPTECSIIHTNYLIPAALPNGLQIVPIGKPISNARAYILDNYFHPVPPGVKGELFIGGIGVGRGYWNQPGLTAERFLPDPFWPGGRMYRTGDIVRQLPDGTICFLGRADDQVKIRGYRVELSEIEVVVNEFPGVKDAVVVLWRQNGSETLATYITVMEGYQEQIKNNLHAYLVDRLPFYMLPSFLKVLDEMPLTPSRKIDRRALPRPESGGGEERYLAPRDDIETQLVSIWKEILEVERIGVRDNFFELGGDSLMAVRLFARIQEEFGQLLPLLLLFKEGSVEAVAHALITEENSTHPHGIISIRPEGSEPPLFIISPGLYMRELALVLDPGWPVYGLDPVENGKVVFRKSVQETAKIYCHNLVDFYPQGPYMLLGHSANGYFALELARLLIESGKDMVFLGLLDTYPSGSVWRQANPVDRMKIHLNNLQDKNLPDVLKYFGLSARRFLIRWRRRSAMDAKTIERYELKGQVKEVRSLLLRTYTPEPYEGRVILFSAARRPWYMRWDPMEQWTNILTGQFEIVPIPGDHMSVLKPPQVTLLARKIEALLARHENA
jgi:amino acid adenylation domain-containing protein